MVEIQFHPIAQEDIKELYDYFSRFSLQYADSFVEGLYEHIESLKRFPQMGKEYPENNRYRQLIYQNYRILYFYKEEEEKIIIMIIVHCSRHLKL
ncbi:hypothetical protein LCGC14_1121790 [marine sediment metagenome]|uniref:Plasmid stabilization system protein n=1 Tax=marine sediment metagenome TaxID=412755 RepID=A0A0F9Q9I7_9ZZZZ|nr:type II toxin-antitoxin system RelE/ParE family toxin [archaeon]HEC41012.1 type II toxin-antitoxin system RelE/ParE family toxin [bacterium]